MTTSLSSPVTPANHEWGPGALDHSRALRRAHQQRIAPQRQRWIDRNRYYYESIHRLFRFIIEPGRRVLSLRCQTGDFLHAVAPSEGVGIDISPAMVDIARERHPAFEFYCADPESLKMHRRFDYVLFSDVADTVDVLSALKRLAPLCEPHTRVVIYNYNRLWQNVLDFASRTGLRMPLQEPNWLSEQDMRTLLHIAGFEEINVYRVMLFPKWIPLLSEFLNRVVARLPGVSRLCMIYVLVARPQAAPVDPASVSVSIVVPCKNEKGNIELVVQRTPEMGRHTEILFCDDRSTDGTADEVRRMQALHAQRDIKLVPGPGISKAENVRAGFAAASGDVLMILDADLAVMPEELPYFFHALVERRGDFINGSRLVYPMPRKAMKIANSIGNKFFGLAFSYLIGHPIKDTLCGTKALWRRDWNRVERLWGSWGVKDRWGDYELLFGAAKLQLPIVDLPVHYQERVFGVTKMTRVFWNGVHMLRMCGAAWVKLKRGY
jgi:SAM-dependent methyltransferase